MVHILVIYFWLYCITAKFCVSFLCVIVKCSLCCFACSTLRACFFCHSAEDHFHGLSMTTLINLIIKGWIFIIKWVELKSLLIISYMWIFHGCWIAESWKWSFAVYLFKKDFYYLSGYFSVDGQWSAWSTFSACNASCGGGIQVRSRACNDSRPMYGGKECEGPSMNEQVCNTQKCPGESRGWCGSAVWTLKIYPQNLSIKGKRFHVDT